MPWSASAQDRFVDSMRCEDENDHHSGHSQEGNLTLHPRKLLRGIHIKPCRKDTLAVVHIRADNLEQR